MNAQDSPSIIAGRELVHLIKDALGFPKLPTRRILIDIATDCTVNVYIEAIGTTSLKDVDWSQLGYAKPKITIADVSSEKGDASDE